MLALMAAIAMAPTYDGYRLVWADEFNVDGPPSAANWVYEEGFVRNQELQWYQPENVRCEAGYLIIEGRREIKPNPNYDPSAPADDWKRSRQEATYTSSSIKTAGKHRWTFGRFEMRGKIDIRSGLWPAWWMVGEAREWPRGGEIDMMEFYQRTLLANCAWGSAQRWVAKWDTGKTSIDDVAREAGYASAEAWADDFHVWRMDWDRDWIRLYVDGRLLNETDLSTTINESEDGANPFHEPHHIILNLAIGATGGDPSGTTFPNQFLVDWVRVYQKL